MILVRLIKLRELVNLELRRSLRSLLVSIFKVNKYRIPILLDKPFYQVKKWFIVIHLLY
ncbi:hypothetical protein C8035_v005624 [Colletotrichum spinosum]|uniref:Uncharacterized protein n=1 Tax=Colletotrichum spinosum TaxID=1347390 RepID=A0A4V3HQX6_9PEZI|nr:hypothetical protein C8035_v005624 [Colletotrichum spinosum]